MTPDSFSDGGKFNKLKLAKIYSKKMINDGANFIDIGGGVNPTWSKAYSK